MPVVLFRVDERLIHGQVVVGWGEQLHMDRIAVVDDELAASEWEQELYTLGLPPGMEAEFLDVEGGRRALPRWSGSDERVVVLTRDLETMRRLAQGGGMEDADVNIGGIHHAEGRDRVLPYLFLGDAERQEIRTLLDRGLHLSARDLPGSRRIDARELIGED